MKDKKPKILIVEDDETVAKTISRVLVKDGFSIDCSLTGREAIQKLAENRYSVLICDLELPDINGIEIIRKAFSLHPQLQSIIITGHATVESAVEAIQQHVFDYIPKPFNKDHLRIAVRNAQSKYELVLQNHELIEKLRNQEKELQTKIEIATKSLMQVNEKFKEQARTDALTELYNHRYFQERMEEEVFKALRYQQPLSLMMVDIDMFKRYNDTLGHQKGDELIREVGQLIRKNMRTFDLVARYGGDEFAVILPQTNGTSAVVAAEKLRDVMSKAELDLSSEDFPKGLTVSIGVANLPAHAVNKDELNARADQALYRAKREGRNRVCLPSQPSSPLVVS